MNTESIPYDITEIPLAAYEPGLVAWGVMILIAIACGAALRFWIVRRRRGTVISPLALATRELRDLELRSGQAHLTKETIARATRIAKRLVSLSSPSDLSSLTASELQAHARAAKLPQLLTVADCIAQLDQELYRPTDVTHATAESVARLRLALADYEASLIRRNT